MQPAGTSKETLSSATMPPKRTPTFWTRSNAPATLVPIDPPPSEADSARDARTVAYRVGLSDDTFSPSSQIETLSALPEKFRRISSTPAYRLVAEAIEQQILAGRIRPGEPIGTEAELVKQFGVNRSTVREGIRLLEHDGLVRRESNRRLSVGLPHYEQLATRSTRALVLGEVTFRELYEAAM